MLSLLLIIKPALQSGTRPPVVCSRFCKSPALWHHQLYSLTSLSGGQNFLQSQLTSVVLALDSGGHDEQCERYSQ